VPEGLLRVATPHQGRVSYVAHVPFLKCSPHYPGRSRWVLMMVASPSCIGLPRILGGSASTTVLSGPAQASLALQPARLLQPLRLKFVQSFIRKVFFSHCLDSYRDEPSISRVGLSPAGNLHLRGTPISCVLYSRFSSSNVFPFCWGNRYGLLNQAKEQFPPGPRCPFVKSKREFIQIIIQMRRTKNSLMRSLQPPLQQTSHSIRQRQQAFTNISNMPGNDMFIPFRRQSSLTDPPVGTIGAARFYDRLDS
jgi:hypothetical protein